MGILDRITGLVKGNVNAALDKLEDPVKVLDVVIEDLRRDIANARRQIAEALTEQKMLKGQIEEARKNADLWLERAEKAVRAGDDSLAEQALVEKNKAAKVLENQTPRWEQLEKQTDALKAQLREMELSFEETLSKKEGLVAQARVARAKASSAAATAAPVGSASRAAMDRAEEKIKRLEAGADATREMADDQIANDPKAQFARLDRKVATLDAKDELAKLKEKLNKG